MKVRKAECGGIVLKKIAVERYMRHNSIVLLRTISRRLGRCVVAGMDSKKRRYGDDFESAREMLPTECYKMTKYSIRRGLKVCKRLCGSLNRQS